MSGGQSAATKRSPTVAESRARGVTGVRVLCLEPGCIAHWSRFTFRVLGLLDDEPIDQVSRLRFRCRQCGSTNADVREDVDVAVEIRRQREEKEARKALR